MIYFIYGEQHPTIKKYLKKLKETLLGEDIDEMNYVSLSARYVTVQDIVSEASKPSLFASKKMIVVTEPYFLSTSKEKNDIEKNQNYDELKNYIINPSPYCDLVFVLEAKNVALRSEIYKLLQKHATIKEVETMSLAQFSSAAGQYFIKKNVKISPSALNELVFRCENDLSKFTQDAAKLCLYTKNITLEDVEALVYLKPEQNAFAIAENLIKKNIAKALKIYYDLRIFKEEPVRLIALMASQFRILTQVGYLYEQGGNKDSISKTLGIHPYRVQLALKNLESLSFSASQEVLEKLYNLDYRIKSGQVDPYYGFELFLLNFSA